MGGVANPVDNTLPNACVFTERSGRVWFGHGIGRLECF